MELWNFVEGAWLEMGGVDLVWGGHGSGGNWGLGQGLGEG